MKKFIQILLVLSALLSPAVLFAEAMSNHETAVYITGLMNKPIAIADIDEYEGDLVGVLTAVSLESGITMRLKILVLRSKCSEKLWRELVSRQDKEFIKFPEGSDSPSEEAILLDCIADGNLAFRAYDDKDEATDYFLSRIKEVDVRGVSMKAILLEAPDTEKFAILLQSVSKVGDFNKMIQEIKWLALKE